MPIALLTVCEWTGPTMHDVEIPDPTWALVETAIRALDNDARNDLYLHPTREDVETYLGVSGGAGRYLVTGSIRNATFPTLVDAARPTAPKVERMAGGQIGEFPPNQVVDLDSALVAVKAFFEAGGFECGAAWTYL